MQNLAISAISYCIPGLITRAAIQVDDLKQLKAHVDDKNYLRTCNYLTSCTAYLAEPDDKLVLTIAYEIYSQVCVFSISCSDSKYFSTQFYSARVTESIWIRIVAGRGNMLFLKYGFWMRQ